MPAILTVFGWLFSAMAVALVIPLIFAIAFHETKLIQAFSATLLLFAFIGGGLILAFKDRVTDIQRKHSLIILCGIWLIIPLFATLPFLISGYPEDPVEAVFETISGFTTTGATIFDDLSGLPLSLIFYRSYLQWLGGFTSLVLIVLILAPVIGADHIDPRLSRLNRQGLGTLRHTLFAVRDILPVYVILTLICFLLLTMAQINSFDALCLSLSTLSTGGFMPRAGSIALYGSPAAELILAIFMFFGAVNIFWTRSVFQTRARDFSLKAEPVWVAFVILIFGLFLAIPLFFNLPESGLLSVYQAWRLGLVTAASIVSTSGFLITEQTQDIIPYILLVCFCLIGGGAYSTAGGLKIFRLAALFRQSAYDVRRLIYPHGVRAIAQQTEDERSAAVLRMSANFSVLILAVIALALLLSITDLPFSSSILAAISALANIGPAYGFIEQTDLVTKATFSEFSAVGQLALCFGMILGRIEVLALLSLVNLAYWRS